MLQGKAHHVNCLQKNSSDLFSFQGQVCWEFEDGELTVDRVNVPHKHTLPVTQGLLLKGNLLYKSFFFFLQTFLMIESEIQVTCSYLHYPGHSFYCS